MFCETPASRMGLEFNLPLSFLYLFLAKFFEVLIVKPILWALLAVVISGQVFSQTNCESLSDAQRRLACYDKQAKKIKIRPNPEAEKRQAEEELRAKQKAKALSDASEALKALRRFESRVDTGISYRDYSAPLADAKFEVAQFVRSAEGAMLPDVVSALNKAVGHYSIAGELWRVRFSGSRPRDHFARFDSPALYDILTGTYGMVPKSDLGILYKAALSSLWIDASYEIEVASLLIKDGGAFPKNAYKADSQQQQRTPQAVSLDERYALASNVADVVAKKYPDYSVIISSSKFRNWLNDQSDVKKRAMEGTSAASVLIVLDAYKAQFAD